MRPDFRNTRDFLRSVGIRARLVGNAEYGSSTHRDIGEVNLRLTDMLSRKGVLALWHRGVYPPESMRGTIATRRHEAYSRLRFDDSAESILHRFRR